MKSHSTTKPIFASSFIDRSTKTRSRAEDLQQLSNKKTTKYMLVWRGKVLFDINRAIPKVVLLSADDLRLQHLSNQYSTEKQFVGYYSNNAIFFYDISNWNDPKAGQKIEKSFIDESRHHHPSLPDSWVFCEVRNFLNLISHVDAELAAAAKGLHEWQRSSIFCSKCGSKTIHRMGGWEKHCPDCGTKHFPRIDPVVIMLILRGKKTLLGRSHTWPQGMFSCLAGFMEPGESVEAAAAREAFEETGVEIAEIKYITSQPWPFPASLMIGCRAFAKNNTLNIDDDELEDARWFTRKEVRQAINNPKEWQPAREGSIARFLLDAWVAKKI